MSCSGHHRHLLHLAPRSTNVSTFNNSLLKIWFNLLSPWLGSGNTACTLCKTWTECLKQTKCVFIWLIYNIKLLTVFPSSHLNAWCSSGGDQTRIGYYVIIMHQMQTGILFACTADNLKTYILNTCINNMLFNQTKLIKETLKRWWMKTTV